MAQRTITDFSNAITGLIPRISFPLAQAFVQAAWREIRDARLWSFLVGEGYLQCPNALQTGGVTVTQFSNAVVADATAAAAINAWGLNPPITALQFRINFGPIYNITGWATGTSTLTLDRPYQESTQNGVPYIAYRSYFGPPPNSALMDSNNNLIGYDFLRWIAIEDYTNQAPVFLGRKSEEINLIDPARQNVGAPAMFLVDYQGNYPTSSLYPAGTPIWELYPAPLTFTSYQCQFQRRGSAFVAGQPLPQAISEDCLLRGAEYQGYRWAEANKGRFPELAKTNWLTLMKETRGQFGEKLSKLMAQDEETFPQNMTAPVNVGPPPLSDVWMSGLYLQGHDPFGPAF